MQSLITRPQWSENIQTASTASAQSAQNRTSDNGNPIFRVRSATDVYVVIDPSPNTGNAAQPRIFVQANTDYDIIVQAGDRIAWIGA